MYRASQIALIGLLAIVFTNSVAFAHGGGCRKNSPPCQCRHMDNRVGSVHCH